MITAERDVAFVRSALHGGASQYPGLFVNGKAEHFNDEGRDTGGKPFELVGWEIWWHQTRSVR